LEGLGVEPASASTIAGLRKLVEQGIIGGDERVVCIATGHMLKDPEEAIEVSERPVEVQAEAVLKMMRSAVPAVAYA